MLETVGILLLVTDCIGFTALVIGHKCVVGYFATVIPEGLQQCMVTVSLN